MFNQQNLIRYTDRVILRTHTRGLKILQGRLCAPIICIDIIYYIRVKSKSGYVAWARIVPQIAHPTLNVEIGLSISHHKSLHRCQICQMQYVPTIDINQHIIFGSKSGCVVLCTVSKSESTLLSRASSISSGS